MDDYFVPFEKRPKMNFSICTKYDSQFSSYEGIYWIKIGDEYYVWKTNSASVIEKPVLEISSTQVKEFTTQRENSFLNEDLTLKQTDINVSQTVKATLY